MRRGAILCALLLSGCRAVIPGAAASLPSPGDGAEILGRSADGAAIVASTHGSGPRRVLWIGGIHGDEREGGDRLAAILQGLAEPIARGGTTLRLVHDANPDGTAAKRRTNARGVDLNRNWPSSNFRAAPGFGGSPLSEPETAALHAEFLRFDPAFVVVFHSTPDGPFVNFDGPGEDLARRFAGAARAVDPRWRVVGDMGYPTPGSLGTFVGVDRRIPILTIEFRRGQDPASVLAGATAGMRALLESR